MLMKMISRIAYSGYYSRLTILGKCPRRVVHHTTVIVTDTESVGGFPGSFLEIATVT